MANNLQPDVNATPVVIVNPTTGLPNAGGSSGPTSGTAANGAAASGNPVLVAGQDSGAVTRTLLTSTTGALTVTGTVTASSTTGNVASGVADSGNPVKIGGRYNTTLPALTNGQRGDLQLDASGNAAVLAKGGTWVGQDAVPNDRMMSLGVAGIQDTPGYALNLSTSGFVFNGTTWDRQRGDATGTYLAAVVNYVETTTNLAAAGTYTGANRGPGTTSRYSFFVADVYADQAGTVYVERSTDGTTWRPANGSAGTAVAAGASVQVKLPLTTANYRVRYVNGATAQGAFLLTSALSLN